MSVGAGSIKRAAKAVKTEEKVNPTEEVKAVVEKKTTTKKATTKTTKKPATPKTESKKSAYNSDYVAYGVGQQLPVHLM